MPRAELRQQIHEAILEKRPKLGPNSATTYSSLLHTMANRMEITTLAKLDEFLQNKTRVLKYIDDLPSTSAKKTLLSVIVIWTGENSAVTNVYRERMMEFVKETNEKYRKQEISQSRENAYLTPEELKKHFNNQITLLKRSPSPTNYIDYLIQALMSGVLGIPPRRLEWRMVKTRNYNKENDNYLVGNKVVFNSYKTAKAHGRQEVVIPKEVMNVIRRWMKINPSEYLLPNSKGGLMSASALSHRIGQIYNNTAIGVDVLRSMFVTEVQKDLPKLENPAVIKAKEVAEAMGHSFSSSQLYYNKN